MRRRSDQPAKQARPSSRITEKQASKRPVFSVAIEKAKKLVIVWVGSLSKMFSDRIFFGRSNLSYLV